MNAPLPFCSVVIVNYNGKHLLQDCLTAVLAQKYPWFEVIVVDNASTDGSPEYVASNFPGVILVRSATNTGFAGGNNLGVRQAKGSLIALLNNDAVAADDWLEALVRAVAPETVAVAGSLIRTDGVPDRYYEMNGSLNFLGHNIMRKFTRPENTFFAGGASLIFKRDLLGMPFDDEYFLYIEDVYLGMRARFLGYEVVQTPDSLVRHRGRDSTRKERSSLMTMYQERNRMLTMLLFLSGRTLVKLIPLYGLNCCAKLAAAATGVRYSVSGLVRAYFWLFIHPSLIAGKRRLLRNGRTAPERDVTSWMTSDITNGESAPGRAINSCAHKYFRLCGIRTLEDMPPGSR